MRYQYQLVIEPLSPEDGGGFLVTVPDLPGCISDGDTHEEALRNVEAAIDDWIDAMRELGQEIPAPTYHAA
jgi:antitoxin HicB